MLPPPGGVFRHERKFILPPLSPAEARELAVRLPGRFRATYPDRRVNSLYLDAEDLPLLHQNVAGAPERAKARIRWYGGFAGVAAPSLEFKIKRGHLGRKVTHPLPEVALAHPGGAEALLAAARTAASLSEWAREFVAPLRPARFTCYTRAYFASACGRFRVTLDRDLALLDPAGRELPIAAPRDTILELKYAPEDDAEARSIAAALPARLARHSKYVRGFAG